MTQPVATKTPPSAMDKTLRAYEAFRTEQKADDQSTHNFGSGEAELSYSCVSRDDGALSAEDLSEATGLSFRTVYALDYNDSDSDANEDAVFVADGVVVFQRHSKGSYCDEDYDANLNVTITECTAENQAALVKEAADRSRQYAFGYLLENAATLPQLLDFLAANLNANQILPESRLTAAAALTEVATKLAATPAPRSPSRRPAPR